MQADQPQPVMEASLPTSSNKNIGTLATDVNSYYGPTVGDGEEDLDDPWDDHHDSELVDENHNGAAGEFTTFNSNHEELLVDRDGDDEEEDSELEDKFHCRPRYQHTRVDVSSTYIYLLPQPPKLNRLLIYPDPEMVAKICHFIIAIILTYRRRAWRGLYVQANTNSSHVLLTVFPFAHQFFILYLENHGSRDREKSFVQRERQ